MKTHVRRILAIFALTVATAAAERSPNVVIIYMDDMGYADIGPFGAKNCATPNLDKMAAEGTKFTSFYSAQAVCSASRAALMTGCYANYEQVTLTAPELYDLDPDPGQKSNVADANPEALRKMLEYAEAARADLGDQLTKRNGPGRRPTGIVEGDAAFPNQFPVTSK